MQEHITANAAKWSGSGYNQDMERKYAWKRVPPKSGEPSTKKVYSDGKTKTYHWCPYHSQWTIHSSAECKRLKSGKNKKEYKNRKAIKKQDFKDKKQAYIQAKAAYQACMNEHSSNENSESDSESNDEDSNKSFTSYSSEGSNES